MRKATITIEDIFGNGSSKASIFDWHFRCELFHKQYGICYWCFKRMSLNHIYFTKSGKFKFNPNFATFEHLIPRCMGGKRRSKKNIVLAHSSCNHKREKHCWPHDPVFGMKNVVYLTPIRMTKEIDVFDGPVIGHVS